MPTWVVFNALVVRPRRGRGGGIVDREEYKPESDGEEDSDDDKRSGGKGESVEEEMSGVTTICFPWS